jgi:hypothetical protein
MSVRVERAEFDPENGFLYYVIFKPNLEVGSEHVQIRANVETSISLTETGELADLAFIVPTELRNQQALSFICGDGQGSYVEPRVSMAVSGFPGDTVVNLLGGLEVDLAGRIVGLVLQWQPTGAARA